ncbi:MAG: hypothetical protein FWE93_01575 [Alphaproteobacteria bacterium]|nr:hypothetical protein [Alphaproteobacteria bacterium]
MRTRRLYRNKTVGFALNIALSAIDDLLHNPELLEAIQKNFAVFAGETHGLFFPMSNGDAFLLWEKPVDAKPLTAKISEVILEGYKAAPSLLSGYKLPDNYESLREKIGSYIEDVRARREEQEDFAVIDSDMGSLTAKNVNQIEQLLKKIDVAKFGRSQNVYRENNHKWDKIAEEFFVSFADLRKEFFPKLDIANSEHFFFALGAVLDRSFLKILTDSYGTIAGQVINLNLSVVSVMSPVFVGFIKGIPAAQRPLIGFKIHSGDLFQNFMLSLSAIDLIKQNNFRVVIDSVPPKLPVYMDFGKVNADWIKVNASKDNVPDLGEKEVLEALAKIPHGKLFFGRCDSAKALTIGRQLNVSGFQGWLIDDLAEQDM